MRVRLSLAAQMIKRLQSEDHLKIAYLIGLALGDGNLSNPNGRALRLRITCDLKYPYLISKVITLISHILPNNKVSIVKRNDNCLDISCYSNKWQEILGWTAGQGSKFDQNIAIPGWILSTEKYSIECLRGLIETDGSIYLDRGYKAVMFVNTANILIQQVVDIMNNLNFKPHIYSYKTKTNHKKIYRVRLSKDVQRFLDIIKPEKR